MRFPPSAPSVLVWSAFVVAGGLVGWFIPGFYEWTGSDQSRPSPLLWKVPLGSAVAGLGFILLLPWLPIFPTPHPAAERRRMRFGVKTLMMITAGVALATALFMKVPLVASAIVLGGVGIEAMRWAIRNPPDRLALATLIACLFLPYCWVLGYAELDRLLPHLVTSLPGMPAFVPAAILGGFLDMHLHQSLWLSYLMTAAELAVGLWMIRRGPKRTVAYLLGVVHVSALGSLVFYQLCIA